MSAPFIRPARPADAPVILDFIRALAAYEKLADQVRASEADIVGVLFSETPRAFCDIAEIDGAPVGLAVWFYNLSTFTGRHGIYLEDLFVRPAFRRNGIARGLFQWLAKKAVAEECGRFEWSVLDWNENAIAFYRALGALPLSEWTVQRLTGEALHRLAKEC